MKATPDNYQPRTMNLLCQEALEILRDSQNQPLGCGCIGGRLFPDAIHRGSAPFARIAGKVMKRLEAADLAVWSFSNYSGWIVSRKGRICDYQ